jgi:predicted permease
MVLLRALLGMENPLPIEITLDLAPDARVLLFTITISILAGVLLGLAPALQSTRRDVASAIKDANTGGGKPSRVSLRNVLVAGQVAASLVLLVMASLFLRSLLARQNTDVGFGAAPAATVTFVVPTDKYTAETGRLFLRRALDDVARLPGVANVGVTSNLHLNITSTNWIDVNVDGHTPADGASAFQIDFNVADAGWFDAVGIRLLRGRLFDEAIDHPDAARVAVVNQAFVDRFWPGEDGLGRTIRSDDGELRVVGVVATARIRTLGEAPRPFIYQPISQRFSRYITLVARTDGNPDHLLPDVFSTLRDLSRDIVFIETKTMERHLSTMLFPARLGALAVGAAASLALLLAIIGLYGVVSYAVASRAREVGIRMSLGAEGASVVRLMMSGALSVVGVGIVVGLLLAVAGGSLLEGLLFGVRAFDPLTLTAVPVLLLLVALLAAWLPARRASRIDPVRALRVQ